jgi:recombination protein RecA
MRGPRPRFRIALYRAEYLRSIPISDEERQIIIGTLLGDGCVTLTKQGRGMLNVTHTTKTEGYFYWKLRSLPRLFFEDHVVRRSNGLKRGRATSSLSAYSIVRDELTSMRALFYPKGIKLVPSRIASDLTALSIAVWYMDDGSLSTRGNSHRIILATNAFDDSSIRRLILSLKRHGVTAKAMRFGHAGQKVIYIGKRSNISRFADLVRPFIHSDMAYKLPTDLPC